MAESGQQSDEPRAVRSAAPAPRKKVTISLTPAQAAQLRVLWQEHSAALHAMLTGWCGSAQNASDLLQEVFRRLAESPSVMGKMKNARAFLAVSSRRLAVDFSRRSATRVAYQAAAGAELPVVQNPGPTDENLRAAIKSALQGLPAEQRAVFEHKVLNGRTLEEIARLEDISLNTAASRLRYALDKIRGQLRPYYDDLNRQQFKNMKNDLNQDLSENKRIITPLEPKRVPSVVPGLEGLAALSVDDGHSDAPVPDQAECDVAPAVEAPAPEVVEPQVHVDPVFVEPPTTEIDAGHVDHSADTDGGDHSGEDPLAGISADGGEAPVVPNIDENSDAFVCCTLPEDFMTGIFDGNLDSTDGGEEQVPFDLENGFEICVLPMPYDLAGPDAHEDWASLFDSKQLLSDYNNFLSDNPDWVEHNQGGEMQAQVITASAYFNDLEFGNPGEAAAFDHWFETNHVSQNDNHDRGGDGSGVIDPHWRGGPDLAYTVSGPGAGSLFGPGLNPGGGPGSFGGETVATGGEVVLGDNIAVDHAHGNVVTLSNGSEIVLEGGRVVSGENVFNHDHDFASHDDAGTQSVEIAGTEVSSPESAAAFGNVAAGLAPNPGQALIVEFGVLSPSEVSGQHTEVTHESPSLIHSTDELPHVVTLSSEHAPAESAHDEFAVHAVAAGDSGAHPDANQHDVVADAPVPVAKHDSTTVAAGAVAVGGVAHGSGAAAAAARKPLPQI